MLALLSACSNTTKQTAQYYLLMSDSNTGGQKSRDNAVNIKLYLQNIRLPQYLKQPKLVILKEGNQLHFSHYHLWAESVEQGISKIVKQQLPQVTWFNKMHADAISLVIEVDDFYPTTQGEVILKGRYWLQQGEKIKLINFSYTTSLESDGFVNAVKQMQSLLILFSADIEKAAIKFHLQ